MHRLFVALRPPAAVRRSLLDAMGGIAHARWQDNDQLHLTLRYIGKVERPVAEDIAIALQGVRAGPVTLRISGVGEFQGKHRTESVWAGVTPVDGVTALHHKIDHAMLRLGLAAEGRAYRPHITLARLGRAAGPVEPFLIATAALTSDPFRLNHFLLFESELGPDGSSYSAVARYPLLG